MAVGTVSGANLDEQWQLIATNTPSAATSSTFSSLSGYKMYMIVYKNLSHTAATYALVRFNGDSTTGNYGSSAWWVNTLNSYDATGILAWGYGGDAVSNRTGIVTVTNANQSVPKHVDVKGYITQMANGVWVGNEPITSISFSVPAGTMTGTIYLYGIAA